MRAKHHPHRATRLFSLKPSIGRTRRQTHVQDCASVLKPENRAQSTMQISHDPGWLLKMDRLAARGDLRVHDALSPAVSKTNRSGQFRLSRERFKKGNAKRILVAYQHCGRDR
jgi:hypothetical protein